jgi:hypothetical protein
MKESFREILQILVSPLLVRFLLLRVLMILLTKN